MCRRLPTRALWAFAVARRDRARGAPINATVAPKRPYFSIEHVARRTQAHCLGHMARLGRHRQHHCLDRRLTALERLQHLEARALAQPQVEQPHLGLLALCLDNSFGGVAAGAYHLVASGFQQRVQPFAQQQWVVHEVDPGHVPRAPLMIKPVVFMKIFLSLTLLDTQCPGADDPK